MKIHKKRRSHRFVKNAHDFLTENMNRPKKVFVKYTQIPTKSNVMPCESKTTLLFGNMKEITLDMRQISFSYIEIRLLILENDNIPFFVLHHHAIYVFPDSSPFAFLDQGDNVEMSVRL